MGRKGAKKSKRTEVAEFRNEPVLDFKQESDLREQRAALQRVRGLLGREYDLIIGGRRRKAPSTFRSINPANRTEVVGIFQSATPALADEAVELAARAFESWKRKTASERARVLLRAASLLRERRFECNAWMILEVGKTWVEADADTAEAIDFCEFYAREALRYAGEHPIVKLPGEKNELRYIPLGVGAVIPPWNFPCAIMVGMTAAALVTGNAVVLKPSSDAPAVAAFFMEILAEAGLPPDVVSFVTGGGGSVGSRLVQHPKTRFVAFTGSKEVGLEINQEASRPRPGQLWIKRVVAEMGGKDFIIVDRTARLQEAITGVLHSAFGFQGQKCSACSRAIIHRAVYPDFVRGLIEQVHEIQVGDPEDPGRYMGPVINQAALEKIMGYIEAGKQEGTLLAGGRTVGGQGFFIEPTVFGDVPPGARIAREEIFGPVLALVPVDSFDEAIRIANDSEYGLTGSVYSSDRAHIERAKQECHVGNFYVNRKCTGALVGVHPFGGFNMSGTDSKAGGRDYLLLFTQAKAISEKV